MELRKFGVVLASIAVAGAIGSCAVAEGIEVHGYFQNRLYVAPGANAAFRVERVSLQTKAALANDSAAYAEVYYHPWTSSNGLYLESAYYESPILGGRARVGKGRRVTFGITPVYGNRKTSNYGIVSEAFTQDRIQGVQYTATRGKWDLAASVHTGYRLGIRNIGDIPGDDIRQAPTATSAGHVVPHLAFRDPHSGGGNAGPAPSQLSRELQFSGRAGLKLAAGLSAGLSASFGQIDERDLANLQGTSSDNILRPRNPITGTTPSSPIGPGFTSRTLRQTGLDLSYRHASGLVAQGELYGASVSDLDFSAWDVLVGKELANGWKFYTRYSQQNMDIAPTDNPLTWDTRQLTFSVVQPIRKNAWLQYEYEINTEDNGGTGGVSNNLFFAELFTAF